MCIKKITKRIFTAVAAMLLAVSAMPMPTAASDGIKIDEENFPDYYFRAFASSKDLDEDGYLSDEELLQVDKIDGGQRIHDYTGMKYFTEATWFRSMDTRYVTEIDFSENKKLNRIDIGMSQMTSVDLSNNTELTDLYLVNDNDRLTSLDLSHNTKLERLEVRNNALTSLDLSNNTELKYLNCSHNKLKSINFGSCNKLEIINCGDNQLDSEYDLTGMENLEDATFYKNDGVRIKVDGLKKLKTLELSGTGMTELKISDCPSLSHIYCSENSITSVDIKNCGVEYLRLENNQLQSLSNLNLPQLSYLWVNDNCLTSLDLAGCVSLEYLYCYNNKLTSLDLSGNGALKELECNNNLLTQLNISECKKLSELNCDNNRLESLNIDDTEENLWHVYCSDNPMRNLAINSNHAIWVSCNNGQLANIDDVNMPKVNYLHFDNNQIGAVDLSKYPSVREAHFNDNRLTSLDTSRNGELNVLNCDRNNLTSLDVSQNKSIAHTGGDWNCVNAADNRFEIEPDVSGKYDLDELAKLSGFQLSRAGDWVGGTVNGSILTVDDGAAKVTYSYILKSSDGSDPITETFTLALKGRCEHTHLSEWKIAESEHYKVCLDCQLIAVREQHSSTGINTANCRRGAICDECGAEYGKLGEHVSGAPADCTHPQVCTVCSTELKSALGHDYSSAWTIDRQPTSEADGEKSHHCTRCDARADITPIPKEAQSFIDVKKGSWYCEAVSFVVDRGLFNGVSKTEFAPDKPMTRAMLVTVLWRLDGQSTPSDRASFIDVEDDTWYTQAVAWASENDIVNGTTPTTFSPDDNITREQMATLLYRYASYKNYDTSSRGDISKFDDAGRVSGYATEPMRWANGAELITGTGQNLEPRRNATRAQVATILMRYCNNVAK